MALKHTIDQQVYTNSLLIYPNFDEDKISQYYWRRKNSYFSACYEQKITQYPPDLSYQCSVLDYQSTIQLITIDHNSRKTVYSYGPVKLQLQLLHYSKSQIISYNIQVCFSKRQKIEAILRFQKQQNHIDVIMQLQNCLKINLNYKVDSHISNIISVQGTETTQLLFSFAQNKKILLQKFRSLKLYSVCGNFIKVCFQSQFRRDLFLMHFLSFFKYQLDGLKLSKQILPQKQKLIDMKDFKQRKTPSPTLQTQLNGLFLSQKQPISPKTPNIGQQVLNEIYDILYTPKIFTPLQVSKQQKQKFQQLSIQKFRQINPKFQKKKNNRDILSDSCIAQQYLILFQKAKRLEQENQILKNQNKQLKTKLKNNEEKKKASKKYVPQFIKELEINRAIKKMKTDYEEEKQSESRIMTQKSSSKKLQTNSAYKTLTFGKYQGLTKTSHKILFAKMHSSPTKSEKNRKSSSKSKKDIIKSMAIFNKNKMHCRYKTSQRLCQQQE